MKINQTEISYDVKKQAQVTSQGNPWLFHDRTDLLQNFQVKPGIFTALFGGSFTTDNLKTHTYEFDRTFETLAMPGGKRYDEIGKDLKKDQHDMKYYGVPSFGLRYNVMAQDWMDRRQPGTMELMNEAYVESQMALKAERAWGLFTEYGIASLLLTDQNIILDGPYTQYNYYTDLIGGARPAKVDMKLDENVNHEDLMNAEVDNITQKIMKAGMSAGMMVCLCGTTYFNQRLEIEKLTTLNREIRNRLDLASMPVPESSFGTGDLPYRNFEGMLDGVLYIHIGNEILTGTKVIADTDAYLMPMGLSGWLAKAYAPAIDRENVNKEARDMYMWSYEDRFGLNTYFESNVLFANRRPEFITHLKNT